MAAPYESEVTFLVGVDDENTAAETAYATWQNSAIPATYGETSKAIKWGNSTPGTEATVSYYFDDGVKLVRAKSRTPGKAPSHCGRP